MPKRGIEDFIAHWSAASASERSNSQSFLRDLCDVLDVPHPDNHPDNGYFFEYPVTERHADGTTSQGRIDLYKRACFVLESKQFQQAKVEASQLELAAEEAGVIARKRSSQPVRGTGAWDDAMTKAKGQAERYIRALPEANPPFIIVADVGHTFEVYADFTQAGKAYQPFPDPRAFRIRLADLADAKVRERLRLIWTNPIALDPSRVAADVTREVSAHLAELAKSLEQAGHEPETVAQFLTRCLFCMFAEDVGLLPDHAFTEMLNGLPADGSGFQEFMGQLFREMNTGTGKGLSLVLRRKLLQFNGGLFADDTVLPLNGLQLGLLKEAAKQNWSNVEPAIFGTLLERALNPDERHQLGAHFTPRAYVERLVLPTVTEPLRAEWVNVHAAAITHARAGDLKKARAVVNAFHAKLCTLKVLDPACGTGNFLYVALQQLKVLEGEVLDRAAQFGENFKLELETHTIDPHQFLGIEINPRAAAIAELVLWIGYLQWHYKIHGQRTPREPILRAFKNIECRDAVLAYDGKPQPARDADGNEITVWDRKSKKTDMVTGRNVPDETKRVPLLTYSNPRPAEWPTADVIVGNPPFMGDKLMRDELGDSYVEALRSVYPDVPESANFVMYWWRNAAAMVADGRSKRFGLITTNAIGQTFNRRVVQAYLTTKQISLVFAIPDHPWVDAKDGASVRIAMTVGEPGEHDGNLLEVTNESSQADGSAKVGFKTKSGQIQADISIGVNLTAMPQLNANQNLNSNGMMLAGSGFIVTEDEAKAMGLGKVKGLDKHIRPYRNGKDLTDIPRGVMAIDFFGLTENEVRERFPGAFQHVLNNVKPERDANRRPKLRLNWWIFGEPRKGFRAASKGISRYIATVETSKHRFFTFLDSSILPDHKLNIFSLGDAFYLGIMSSRIHCVFALAAGSVLEDRPVYLQSRCFLPFPFPLCAEAAKDRVRTLAEELDAHRKRAQSQHGLTLTGLYNVLEKIRAEAPLDANEKLIHDKGLVSILHQLHEELDEAVFAAYGWQDLWQRRKECASGRIWDFEAGAHLLLDTGPEGLEEATAKFESDLNAEILKRLVALNAERAAEEERGIIHWLRPEYQTTVQAGRTKQNELSLPEPKKPEAAKSNKSKRKAEWPETLAERVRLVEEALHTHNDPVTPADIAKHFLRARSAKVAEILETLVTMGRAHKKGGKFVR